MVENRLTLSRWRRLARPGGPQPAGDGERCELCAVPLSEEHRHLLDVSTGELRCACIACALLFDPDGAGGKQYRAIPRRCVELRDLDLDDLAWAALDVPVGLAFFIADEAGAVTAVYPNPLGVVESAPDRGAWSDLVAANPALRSIRPRVEALLAYRRPATPRYWVAPVDVCYRLASLVRTHWEGFTGGATVWGEVERFLDGLDPGGGRALTGAPAAARTDKEASCDRS